MLATSLIMSERRVQQMHPFARRMDDSESDLIETIAKKSSRVKKKHRFFFFEDYQGEQERKRGQN